MSNACRVVVLISGNGSNLQAIIDRQAELSIEIVGVISNRPDVYGLERAQQANINTKVLDHTTFESRELFDNELSELIESYQPELVVLAGYMRIMTQELVKHFEGKMLNIHPSILPKYPGLNTHRRAIEAGDSEHGSSVHFVTEVLDGGPIIAQAKLNITENDTEQSLADRIKQLEHTLFPKVIGWFAASRLEFKQNQTYLDGKLLSSPLLIE
ncbi:MAG: phosphoribosylglycinamide formyltransferase [Gammaproteobacteria bacterium]|nr:phosphoribosylglycinamide formyltransferase [Gammaproteobacteria bacterium]